MRETVDHTLRLVEMLASYPGGAPLARLSDTLGLTAAEVESLLADLVACGYVCQARSDNSYALTTKLSCLGLAFLSRSRVVEVAQPVLDRLAEKTGGFAWLSVVDGDRLPWLVRGGNAHRGMRFDYAIGTDAQLSCSATGHAWLLTLSDEEATARVLRQGFGEPSRFGPNAPTTMDAVMALVRQARARGYSLAVDMFVTGLSSIAAPVRATGEAAIGVISTGGPSELFPPARLHEMAPALLEAAAELAAARGGSQLLLRLVAAGRRPGRSI